MVTVDALGNTCYVRDRTRAGSPTAGMLLEGFMRHYSVRLAVFAGLATAVAAHADTRNPSPMLTFVRPDHAVPVTATTSDEGQAVLKTLADKERAQLLKDGILVLGAKRAGELPGMKVGYLVAGVPREDVWRLIRAASEWNKYIPRVRKSRRVDGGPNYEIANIQLQASFVSINFQIEVKAWPEASRLAWALDPAYANDLQLQEGYFNVFALDERTSLVEYGTRVRSSPLLPAFVESYLVDRVLPDGLVGIKKYLDSGGTYRKE